VRYLGVDIAWSARGLSGACALGHDGTILAEDVLPPERLAAWVARWRGARSVLALDGPLVVPADGAAVRACERELHRRYGARRAGPYPGGAGSIFLAGRAMSPALALARAGGASEDPFDFAARHRAIEVFPAPAWLELFPGEPRLVYKRGRKEARARALAALRARLGPSGGADEVARRWGLARTLRDWKAIEDLLDARLCARLALLWDRTRACDWVVTGPGASWRAGYVVVPRLDAIPRICYASGESRSRGGAP
jgi:predicted RNase H-like nuclease